MEYEELNGIKNLGLESIKARIEYLHELYSNRDTVEKITNFETKELLDLLNFIKTENKEATSISENNIKGDGFNIIFETIDNNLKE